MPVVNPGTMRARKRIAGSSGPWTPPTDNLLSDFDPGNASTVTIATGVSALANAYADSGVVGLVQATAAYQPTILSANLNGKDVLSFDGTNDALKSSASDSHAHPTTCYVVVKMRTWKGNTYIFDGRNTVQMGLSEGNLSGSEPEIGLVATTYSPKTSDLAEGAWGIVTAVYNGTSSTIRVNKLPGVTGNSGTATNAEGLTLGAAAPPSNNGAVDIARHLRYSGAHDTATQDGIIEDLASLYGLTV
jgi:hypothetical protein